MRFERAAVLRAVAEDRMLPVLKDVEPDEGDDRLIGGERHPAAQVERKDRGARDEHEQQHGAQGAEWVEGGFQDGLNRSSRENAQSEPGTQKGRPAVEIAKRPD